LQEGNIVAADSKARLLADAEEYVLHGKIRLAIAEYLKILSLDPEDILILNTIGDLYLQQNNPAEANRFFHQVADRYARDSFFLKAIAVYKKILKSDPDNFEINSTLASLYARQGLTLEACNQYLRLVDMLDRDGRSKETLEIYETIVELDPLNSEIHRKLAGMYREVNDEDNAQAHWISAGRAYLKTGDFFSAINAYRNAMQIRPLAMEIIREFLDSCLKAGDISPALELLKESLQKFPSDPGLREMLGQVYLALGDLGEASKAFHEVFSMQESRYENFFLLGRAFLDKDMYDEAANCLDGIVHVLITRRATGRAIEHYLKILEHQPKHILTLSKLAYLYSATGEQVRYLEILGRLADSCFEENRSVEALEYAEKILQDDPENDRYRQLHYDAFTAAYPDMPYTPPAQLEYSDESTSLGADYSDNGKSTIEGDLLEVDLLLNYGLKDKALDMLRNMESREPGNKEVRLRLLSFYKAEQMNEEATEQCLMLAALHRAAKNEETAQTFLDEAARLSPKLSIDDVDLATFAWKKGIGRPVQTVSVEEPCESEESEPADSTNAAAGFAVTGNDAAVKLPKAKPASPAVNQYTRAPEKSLEEQFQEVDFYICLGFNEEALAKLDEIAKICPSNPELLARYEQLGKLPSMESTVEEEPAPIALGGETGQSEYALDFDSPENIQFDAEEDDEMSSIQGTDSWDMAPETFVSNSESPTYAPEIHQPEFHSVQAAPHKVNDMFADLMEEVSAPLNMADTDEEFEEHYNLGIAYREMDLMDEAIKEFETALKKIAIKKGDPRVIQCCEMLSTCFLKKNMPRSAVRWCQTGLKLTDVSSNEAMAFSYDLGVAQAMAGNKEQALNCFDLIFSKDPEYRDVAQRIDELKDGFQRHVP